DALGLSRSLVPGDVGRRQARSAEVSEERPEPGQAEAEPLDRPSLVRLVLLFQFVEQHPDRHAVRAWDDHAAFDDRALALAKKLFGLGLLLALARLADGASVLAVLDPPDLGLAQHARRCRVLVAH